MRIKMLAVYAGPAGTFPAGCELDDKSLPGGLSEAQALVSAGAAVPVKVAPERSVPTAPEVRQEPQDEVDAPTGGRVQATRSAAKPRR